MGFKSQAEESALSGRMAKRSANFNANQSLVSGGLQAASYAVQASGKKD